ncbi:unnamed protein product [Prorocentrum cordatum]|uniref:DUF4326 domain-containing protein n=1 Tax=Prorocentrum cordatum TaxID=2364126 RepID=A0ABN9WAU8_9DINO|nr:unnamed protein product [Polarella glacialis]
MAEPRGQLAADLRFLLEEKEVPDAVQDAMARQGYNTLNRFALLGDDRAQVRAVLARDFGLDPAAGREGGPAARLAIVKVIDAWETACLRAEEDRKRGAEAKSARLPKLIGKATHLSMREAAQQIHGVIEDRVAPGAPLVEQVMEMIEESNMEAIPLTQVVSIEDGDDSKIGAAAFRKRIRTLALAYVYARLRHPGRPALKSASVELFNEYLEYILGDHVRGLTAKGLQGNIVSRPNWNQVMHYDHQIRKEHARMMNFGKTFEQALRGAWNDTSLRDRHFITQILLRKTPDGRNICFACTNEQENCRGDCGMVHVCRICLGNHPVYQHRPGGRGGHGPQPALADAPAAGGGGLGAPPLRAGPGRLSAASGDEGPPDAADAPAGPGAVPHEDRSVQVEAVASPPAAGAAPSGGPLVLAAAATLLPGGRCGPPPGPRGAVLRTRGAAGHGDDADFGSGGAGPGSRVPARTHLRVLYLFSGLSRRASIKECLEEKVAATPLELEVVEVEDVREGAYGVVIVTPPCSTFLRSLFANRRGPPPLRNAMWPLGFPWLQGPSKERVQDANILGLLAAQILEAVIHARSVGHRARGLMEFPEDLGARRAIGRVRAIAWGRPASLWQLPQFRRITRPDSGFVTFAFRQLEFGVLCPKPARFLTDLGALAAGRALGWPDLDGEGWCRGPLSPPPSGSRQLVTPDGRRKRELADTAAYPVAMYRWIATAIIEDFLTPFDPLRDGVMVGGGPPPSRATISQVGQLLPGDVYIGRGSSREGLEKSPWHNPWEISGGLSRDAVVDNYAALLASAGPLRAGLRGLGGKRLVCHCLPSERCHGDAIIAACAKLSGGANLPDIDSGNPGSPRKAGDGWLGRGGPLQAPLRRGARGMEDGAGSCSPGRWPFAARRLPDSSVASDLRAALDAALKDLEVEAATEERQRKRSALPPLRAFLLERAAGKFEGDIFSPVLVAKLKTRWRMALSRAGLGPRPRAGGARAPIAFGLLDALGKAFGGPDYRVAVWAAVGVPLGVDTPLPRTPAVYERKLKWALPRLSEDEFAAGDQWAENYSSVRDRPEVIDRYLDEEVAEGRMLKNTLGEARRRWPDRVRVAALGAVQKAAGLDEWRVVFDATHHVLVNHQIRILDQVKLPVWQDIVATLEAVDGLGEPVRFALLYDVARAHRQIPVREEDWGWQACCAPSAASEGEGSEAMTVHVNTVGTGVAHYFGLPMRAVFHLVYADDGLIIATGAVFERKLLLVLLIMVTLGVPLAPGKLRGGVEIDRVGYHILIREVELGISQRRRDWAVRWCSEVADAPVMLVATVREGLGRLMFAAGPLIHIGPFLGPIFAWCASCPRGARLPTPLAVRVALKWAGELIAKCGMRSFKPSLDDRGELFRIDAKAEGDLIVLGGWTTGASPDPGSAKWFSQELKRDEVPWAFEKGAPFRVVASQELLAVVCGVVLFVGPSTFDRRPRRDGQEIVFGRH